MGNQHLFVGSWHDFSLAYPDSAAEYVISHQTLPETFNIEWNSDQVAVVYCASSWQQTVLLGEYHHLLSQASTVIIILEVGIKVHFFDNVPYAQMTVHLVLKDGSYCFYEHEIAHDSVDYIKRRSIVTVYDDAISDYYVLYAGSCAIEHTYLSDTRGNNAQSYLRGIFCGTKNQKITVHSEQKHRNANTQSEVSLKGFAAHNASVSYKGIIAIDSNAFDTIARQEHKTLLLSSTASVESVPVMEVLNKEVQCFHASAVGMLDEASLFYMQSRGVSREHAKRLLLMSFVVCKHEDNQKFFNIDRTIEFLINSFDNL